MFNTIEEAIEWIQSQRKASKRENLNRIKNAYELLGSPAKNIKKIHVAGTNGKGAFCQILNTLLSSNYKVGRFVSPYIINFNERIMLSNQNITDEELLNYINKISDFSKNYYEKYNDNIPFFELTLLIALLYFDDKKADYIILECGIGGLLDSTNFLDYDLSVITSIGYDHMKSLGNTLEEICQNKLGILKNNGTLITAMDKSLHYLADKKAFETNSKVYYLDYDNLDIESTYEYTKFKYDGQTYKINLIGAFQAKNAALAIMAYKLLIKDYNLNDIKNNLLNIFWPGRAEIVNKDPFILIDGAHNISAINTLKDSIRKIDDSKFVVVFSALKDKEYEKMIVSLTDIAKYFIFTLIDDVRSIDYSMIEKYVNGKNIFIENYDELISHILKLKDEKIIIVGSLHFISQIRKKFK